MALTQQSVAVSREDDRLKPGWSTLKRGLKSSSRWVDPGEEAGGEPGKEWQRDEAVSAWSGLPKQGFLSQLLSGGRLDVASCPCTIAWIRYHEDSNVVDSTIETSRLTLRPWVDDDIVQLTLGLNDLRLARWLAFVPHPYSTSHARDWTRRCQDISNATGRPAAYEFAIELKSERLTIGGVSLNKIDWEAGTGGGGIWIASEYQGRGYGREAFEAKIRFAFRDLGLTKLVNGYFDGNEKSWAMQRKLGYRRVAEVTSRCMADGRQTIEHVTTLLRSDWEDREDNGSSRV
jgi:ribosomal-protein-alanine N-acetyltransferase